MRCFPIALAAACLAGLSAFATPAIAAPALPPLVLDADAPVMLGIAGQQIGLRLFTGSIDRVTLSAASAARLGIKPQGLMGKATLKIGNAPALTGRNAVQSFTLAGQPIKQRVFWFQGAVMKGDGSVGPWAFPQQQIRISLGNAGAGDTPHDFPLYGDINSGTYAGVRGRPDIGPGFGVSIAIEADYRLTMVTAATGADLAGALGGTMTGDVWEEEILLGIVRPVRRMVLARPLVVGPFRITEVAVRVRDLRDGTGVLGNEQQIISDDDDPSEIVVTGSSDRNRPVVRLLTLSRRQLGECSAIVLDKAAARYTLECS
ncbi:hypothetical protein [Sandarakinorhabdus sp.]|uniref:hypothetical protein n=1 Tax=Sandarakinorhabdus sp. TaxID=1916663 RepID=UPI00286D901C|nr:hypothetical protein [Sandarakinorhabdus sp.]